jgi:hypothetical protein
MDDSTILDVHVVADPDGMNIAPNYCVEPDAAIVAKHNIAGDGCIICQEAIFTEGRGDPFDFFNECHVYLFSDILG